MAHHAYYVAGERERGIEDARAFALSELGLSGSNNPDIIVFRFGLFSVDDARQVIRMAGQSAVGTGKILIIAAERVFHEAQNALLKLFEEPPPGTTLVLVVPSSGVFIATLRSRMLPLPRAKGGALTNANEEAKAFIAAGADGREKLIQKLLDRAKSDTDSEKQEARGEALRLAEGLLVLTYAANQKKQSAPLAALASDLDRFIPILHERSAPLKLIFEHVMLVTPKDLVL